MKACQHGAAMQGQSFLPLSPCQPAANKISHQSC
jgi:hypothetical protein